MIISAPEEELLKVWMEIWQKTYLSRLVIAVCLFEFDSAVFNPRPPCYLKGYWQSPKYFAPIENMNRRDLRVRTPLSGENKAIAGRIGDSVAVSLHVRRGDYVTS